MIAYIRDRSDHPGEEIVEAVAAQAVRPGEAGRLHTKHDDYFHDHRPHRAVDYWEILESLHIPVLFVRADENSFVSDEEAERMLAVAHAGELVTIPRSGHAVSMDNPVALGRALREFLDPGEVRDP